MGFSQFELAVRIRSRDGTISKYELNKMNPSGEALRRIAAALEVTADWLLYGGESKRRVGEPTANSRMMEVRRGDGGAN